MNIPSISKNCMIVQSLNDGLPGERPELPAEIIEKIFRLAHILNPRPVSIYTVPHRRSSARNRIDPVHIIRKLSDKETLFELKKRHGVTRKLWCATDKFSAGELKILGQIKLSTLSENRGWLDTPLIPGFPSSWWEIAIVRDPPPVEDTEGVNSLFRSVVCDLKKTVSDTDDNDGTDEASGEIVSMRSRRPQIKSDGENLLTWLSHHIEYDLYNRDICEGPEFGPNHEIWQHLQEGDRIGIVGCVEYPAWKFIGYRAVIHIWNLFDPVEFC